MGENENKMSIKSELKMGNALQRKAEKNVKEETKTKT